MKRDEVKSDFYKKRLHFMLRLDHVDKALSNKKPPKRQRVKRSETIRTKMKNALILEVNRNQYRSLVKDRMVTNCLKLQTQTVENRLHSRKIYSMNKKIKRFKADGDVTWVNLSTSLSNVSHINKLLENTRDTSGFDNSILDQLKEPKKDLNKNSKD